MWFCIFLLQSFWGVTLVQLVAILYKDQHAVILQKLLNNWLEVSLTGSSEDNESNTSPPDKGRYLSVVYIVKKCYYLLGTYFFKYNNMTN